MISSPKSEFQRFLRFVLVGLVNTLVDFGLFNLMAGFFRMLLLLAQAISFVAGVATSFLLSRKFVYPEARDGRLSIQLPKFLVINLMGLGLRSVIIPNLNHLFVGLFSSVPLANLSPEFVSRNLAWGISTFVVLLVNFFGNRAWTFRTTHAEGQT